MLLSKVFDGTDPEALQEHLRTITPGLDLTPLQGEGPFHAHSLLIQIGEVKAWRNAYSRHIGLSSLASPDNLVLGMPARGGLKAFAGETNEAAAGGLLTFLTREVKLLEIQPQTKTDNLAIPVSLLNARLAQLLERTPREPLRLKSVIDAQEGGGAAVKAVVHGLLHAADVGPTRSPAALRSLSTALIDLVLEVLPHNYSEALHRPPARIGPRQVRRAVVYIRENPMPVRTVDELAAICGVSVRSLQYTFREFVGMAPSEYWRRIRLERALEEIRRNPSDSVSRIAAAWGFTNSTRFRYLAGLA